MAILKMAISLNITVVGLVKNKDKRNGELTLQLNNFDIDNIEMPEKTLVRFVKS